MAGHLARGRQRVGFTVPPAARAADRVRRRAQPAAPLLPFPDRWANYVLRVAGSYGIVRSRPRMRGLKTGALPARLVSRRVSFCSWGGARRGAATVRAAVWRPGCPRAQPGAPAGRAPCGFGASWFAYVARLVAAWSSCRPMRVAGGAAAAELATVACGAGLRGVASASRPEWARHPAGG